MICFCLSMFLFFLIFLVIYFNCNLTCDNIVSHCSLKVFTFAGIIGVCILLPINFLGDQLSFDFSDLTSKSLDSFSISNVNDGSNRWLLVDFLKWKIHYALLQLQACVFYLAKDSTGCEPNIIAMSNVIFLCILIIYVFLITFNAISYTWSCFIYPTTCKFL